jgi:hypothetical protein
VPTLAEGSWGQWRWAAVREPEDGGREYFGIELEHPDGRRRGCGFGGPITWPGDPLNDYVGWSGDGPVVVLARTRHPDGPMLLVGGVAAEPVWTGRADGVHYLLHLHDADGPEEVAVVLSR